MNSCINIHAHPLFFAPVESGTATHPRLSGSGFYLVALRCRAAGAAFCHILRMVLCQSNNRHRNDLYKRYIELRSPDTLLLTSVHIIPHERRSCPCLTKPLTPVLIQTAPTLPPVGTVSSTAPSPAASMTKSIAVPIITKSTVGAGAPSATCTYPSTRSAKSV